MSGLFYTRGPVALAVAEFVDAPLPLADAPAFLADLIDLPGAVALAEALASTPAPEPATVSPAVLRQAFHAGWVDIRARLDDAIAHAYKARYRLTDPVEGLRLVGQAERPGAAARTIWAPYGAFLDTHTKRARFALRDLRTTLAPLIAGQSAEAAELARLDAALSTAVHTRLEALLRRVHHTAEARFTALLDAAQPDAAGMAALLGPSGSARRLFERALAVSQALVLHERQRLAALVEAAIRSRR